MAENLIKPLDYSRVENWLINANADFNKSYDLIFFCGTSVFEQDRKSGVGNVCDVMRYMGYDNYLICGSQLAEDARIFVPLQRQMALDHESNYTSHKDILLDIRFKAPYIDLEAALDYYFENYNVDAKRPFVLAGHSQGAAALQVCLRQYFLESEDRKDYLKNMIAAYSTGYGVSRIYYDNLPNKEGRLHFAEGADDFNCLISWNTEGMGEKGYNILLSDEDDTTLVINPLNWKRDGTYAGINENKGVLIREHSDEDGLFHYRFSLQTEDLCDAQIDLKRGSVICSTHTDYIADGAMWGGKSLHYQDGPAYYNNMKDNLRLRVAKFFEAKNRNETASL